MSNGIPSKSVAKKRGSRTGQIFKIYETVVGNADASHKPPTRTNVYMNSVDHRLYQNARLVRWLSNIVVCTATKLLVGCPARFCEVSDHVQAQHDAPEFALSNVRYLTKMYPKTYCVCHDVMKRSKRQNGGNLFLIMFKDYDPDTLTPGPTCDDQWSSVAPPTCTSDTPKEYKQFEALFNKPLGPDDRWDPEGVTSTEICSSTATHIMTAAAEHVPAPEYMVRDHGDMLSKFHTEYVHTHVSNISANAKLNPWQKLYVCHNASIGWQPLGNFLPVLVRKLDSVRHMSDWLNTFCPAWKHMYNFNSVINRLND